MPAATKDHIKTNRRAALQFGLAALTTGLAAPDVAANAVNPDAKLITYCTKFLDLDAVIRRWDNGDEGLDEDFADEVTSAWWDLIYEITPIQARTGEGLALKLTAAAAAMRNHADGYSPLRTSLALAVLNESALAHPPEVVPYSDLSLPAACKACLDDISDIGLYAEENVA